MPISLLHRKSDYSRQQISKAMFTLYILDSSLVARHYLLIHCPREVWERERARERVLGEYLSVTQQLMVKSRNYQAENAWELG